MRKPTTLKAMFYIFQKGHVLRCKKNEQHLLITQMVLLTTSNIPVNVDKMF